MSRALSLLDGFDTNNSRLTLSEIARRSGTPLTTTHRLVGELTTWGALTRLSDGRYEIGLRIWSLGLLAQVHRELRDVAVPFLQDLAAVTGENVHLAVREQHEALWIDHIFGSRAVPIVSRAGARLPLYATGVGKVLLAHAPEDVIEAVLADLRPLTPKTITDRSRLRGQIELVRDRRVAHAREEMAIGATSLAVPVAGPAGNVVAALGIVCDSRRRGHDQLIPALRVAASGIGRRLPRSTFHLTE